MRKILLWFFISFSFLLSENDFHEGPYGFNYFDIAGPFTVIDMNMELGDVNQDEIVNILDIIATINHILGFDLFSTDQINQADLNFDSSVDILDVVRLVNIVLGEAAIGIEHYLSDLNQDSVINIQDIILIINLILNNNAY